MAHILPPNYRQQRALDAIEHAATDCGIAIKAHAPNTDVVGQALLSLAAIVETVKAAIMNEEG
jgi:hypothetical protein